MDRVIFHIDVNSAFVSWSAVKILLEGGEDIRLVPSVVSGDPEDRRSIVTARSIPCKKYGIATAEPLSMAIRKCPSLVVVRGDWTWYRKCSDEFIAICRTYSPVLQQFSIDECFLDMTGRLESKDPVAVATALKDDIHKRLGFTVNVGIGSNKLLAKMASDFEKPDKVHTLFLDEIETKLWPLPVRDLLWVGKKTEERLVAYGIDTVGKLAKLGMGSLTSLVGKKAAESMHDAANGIDDSIVDTSEYEAKSSSAERTFSKDITDASSLDRELFKVACELAHRIRVDNFRCSGVSVFVKTSSFETHSRQCTLETPTDITAVILNEARRMIPEIWDGVTPLRQVGLGVHKLTHDKVEQLSLFEDEKMQYYREWDLEYDRKLLEGEPDARHRRKSAKVLDFSYRSREEALLCAKKAVRGGQSLRMESGTGPDGEAYFDVIDQNDRVLERHSFKIFPGAATGAK